MPEFEKHTVETEARERLAETSPGARLPPKAAEVGEGVCVRTGAEREVLVGLSGAQKTTKASPGAVADRALLAGKEPFAPSHIPSG